ATFRWTRWQESVEYAHAAVVGDEGLGAAVCRQGRIEDLQHRGEVLMWGCHPGHNLPRIAFDNTDAIDPTALQLDEVTNIRVPQVMTIRRTIGEMLEADRLRVLISGTLSGDWGPVEVTIDDQRYPDRSLTTEWRVALMPQ